MNYSCSITPWCVWKRWLSCIRTRSDIRVNRIDTSYFNFDKDLKKGMDLRILFHKKLAKKLSQKQNKKYHEVIAYIRAKISFKLLKSMLLCLRGSRTVFQIWTVDNIRLYLQVWFLFIFYLDT